MQFSLSIQLLHDKADLHGLKSPKVNAISAATAASFVKLYNHAIILLRLATSLCLGLGRRSVQLLGI